MKGVPASGQTMGLAKPAINFTLKIIFGFKSTSPRSSRQIGSPYGRR